MGVGQRENRLGVICLFVFFVFCVAFQAVLELPEGNMIVYRKTKNLHSCNCVIYYELHSLWGVFK